MDLYYSKQAVGGIDASRKKPDTVTRDTAGSQDQTAQFCNRIGCCGRLNHPKSTRNKSLEKPKPLKPSFRSSCATSSLSKSCSSVTNVKKSSSASDESEIQKRNDSRSHTERQSKSRNTESKKAILMPVSKSKSTEVASSSTRVRKVKGQPSQIGSSATQLTDRVVKDNGQQSRYDQNSESNNGRKRSTVKKKFVQGESSLSNKGKRVSGVSTNEGTSNSDSRNLRTSTTCRANVVSSVRNRRSLNLETSTRSINQIIGDNSSSVQSSNVIPNMLQTEILWTSAESLSNLNGGHSNSDPLISVTSSDHPIVRFMNRNGARHYDIDEISDVLRALDRIQQDEGLTNEQLLSLETNLFLGDLNFYDQHRDMRLDIDNMSYEELLVLEEKMGTVSTALPEEELSKCIRISIYDSLPLEDGRMRCSWGADDSKCSICQEEYVKGNEIGRLGCGHGYHRPCINQWLSLKNWCPICKAEPQSSLSSSPTTTTTPPDA